MGDYSVYTTEKFDREANKLPEKDKKIIHKLFLNLKENPYSGDQLRYKNLREKRIREKRIYYLVYEDLKAVLIVAIGNKKVQQETINHIISYFEEYRLYLDKILKSK